MVDINGIMRDQKNMTCVNGIWRESNSYPCVNGIWRGNEERMKVPASQVKGFYISYKFDNTIMALGDYETLFTNKHLPVNIHPGGDVDNFDLTPKSIIYEYSDEGMEEGFYIYTGNIIAILQDNSRMSLSQIDAELKVDVTVTHESYGFYCGGLNSFFNTKDIMYDKVTETHESHKKAKRFNNYYISPGYRRADGYRPYAAIGIARDMHSYKRNMIGSHGSFDHTINSISCNGTHLPFTLHIG